jgi:hypothetical protein
MTQVIIIRIVMFLLFAPFAFGFFWIARHAPSSSENDRHISGFLRFLYYLSAVFFMILSLFVADISKLFDPKWFQR